MPQEPLFRLNPNFYHAVLLFLLALANYILMYGANITLARALNVREFDDYNVAISTVTMLSTLATLGLEKYALRAFPIFREREDWRRYRGFWLFSMRTISGFGLFLTLALGLSLDSIWTYYGSNYHISIVVYVGFLPIIGVSLYLVEFQAAHGAYLLSVAIYRLLLPTLYLFFLIGISISLARLSALIAVSCYGMAWLVISLLMLRLSSFFMPAAVPHASPLTEGASWLRNSLPMVMNSLMMTIMTSSGVVILELLYPSGEEVGIYAAAAQTGGFISLIGTSTNRYYLPRMVTLMEQHDKRLIRQLMQERALIVGGLILLLLFLIYLYGENILGLFGTHFHAGYTTLVIIAVGAAISALYADIPYYLQFMGRKRIVFHFTLAATASMVILSFLLGSSIGTLGVALAYMTSVMLLFIGLRIIVELHFERL
ncbi:MAG: lipopolysaccharide biosynthesis protein [Methylosarcina sp.]